MVKAIDNIPRADNQIANSDKTHLWEIRQEDEIVVAAKDEIGQILLENLTIAQKAVNVYDDYLFLLKEPEEVKAFCDNKGRNKQEYIDRIQKYQDTIDKIKAEAPYEIRMSMFLIQCHDLNNTLIHQCEQLIKDIVKNMYEVNLTEAQEVTAEVKKMQDKFQLPAKESDELVRYDADLEEFRSKTRSEIVSRYTNLVEWVQLMYQYPQLEVNEEIHK